ncbi:hypothetical protein K435DRAFT_773360 [Dendrothele bispora CBS 962.96]|uniref:Cation/H+ exchanger transmembrane domain-containing protein n=1 Tax=Dendrothele bispora (strain CBS 962.96) TaxID=1314807 RepID=A0A4S8MVH3_DENBC|nr:hypothetical protein K435DRAFT_773360 [Dendrothele bispora CBS 962.96]
MPFRPFEVNVPHIVYACLGGFVVLFGMFSLFLRERLYIGEACWAFLFGIIIGPYGANIFNPHAWGDSSEETTNAITLEFTRVVLAIGVFAIGVELPKAYMKKHWKSLFFLLGPIMTWGWFISAAFIYALVPGLNFLSSLCVAACLTPTDPILAAAVIGGKYADKHVPAHIRHLLAAESGCNDGAAFPFLYIAIYLIIDKSTGEAVRDWFLLLWLYQVLLGVLIGAALGFAFRYLMKFCQRHDLIDRHSYVAQYVSLALLTIGIVVLLGSDDLLSTFACGTAFAWDGFFNIQTSETSFSSVIDLLFNIAAFVYVGAWMPFNMFSMKEELTLEVWRLVVIAILVLVFRRLPVMMACYKWMPDVKTAREALFSGHFGPIGVGAVFISTLAAEVLNEHIDEVDATNSSNTSGAEGGGEEVGDQTRLLAKAIQPIVAFMVLCSIMVHGLSIPGFSLSKRIHSRTFSRRTTIGAATGGRGTMDGNGGAAGPEWATQVGIIKSPEDVVINRDPEHVRRRRKDQQPEGDEKKDGVEDDEKDAERRRRDEVDRAERGEGSLSIEEKERMEDDGSPGESTVLERKSSDRLSKTSSSLGETQPVVFARDHATKRVSSSSSSSSASSSSRQPQQQQQVVTDAGAERVLDSAEVEEAEAEGGEGVIEEDEWREGPHRVIERRRGLGEEVEVEVVRNYYYEGHGHSHHHHHGLGGLTGKRTRKDSTKSSRSHKSGKSVKGGGGGEQGGSRRHERKIFRGTSSEDARGQVKEYLARLGGEAKEEVEKVEERVSEEVGKVEERVGSEVGKVEEKVGEIVDIGSGGGDEEEWASENDEDDGDNDKDNETAKLRHSSGSRSKSPKMSGSGSVRRKSVRSSKGGGGGGGGLMGRVMRRARNAVPAIGTSGSSSTSDHRFASSTITSQGAQPERAYEQDGEEEEERGRGRSRGRLATTAAATTGAEANAIPTVVVPSSSPSPNPTSNNTPATGTGTGTGIGIPLTRTRSQSPLSAGHRRSYSGQLGLGHNNNNNNNNRLRHHRLDSLRVDHTPSGLGSREQSPARSIRFFDEQQQQQPASAPAHRDSFGMGGGGSGGGGGGSRSGSQPGTPMHGD